MNVTLDKSVGARLNEFILILRVSQSAFSQSINVSRGYLNDVLNGRKGIGTGALIGIAKAYSDLNMRWLLTGEGEMFTAQDYQLQLPPDSHKLEEPPLNKYDAVAKLKNMVDDHERRLIALENRK